MRAFHRMLSGFNMHTVSPFTSSRQAMQNVQNRFTRWITELSACHSR
jgi:hypothetical protein